MILAPATMASEPDPKTSAAKCLLEIQLDPESYRIGHTKASSRKLSFLLLLLSNRIPEFSFDTYPIDE